MAGKRYSTFKYGDGTHYGASTPTETGEVTWIVWVEWGNGVANEGGRTKYVKTERGKKYYTAPGGNGFEPIHVGKCTIELDNYDKRYDPYYVGGPLENYLLPMTHIQVMVKVNATGTTYELFTGYIEDIRPVRGPKGNRRVRFECVDWLGALARAETPLSVATTRTTLTNAFTRLLDSMGYIKKNLLVDSDTQPIIVFDINGRNALQVANDLAAAGLGVFFCNRTGKLCYYGRGHSSWTTHTLDQAQCREDILMSQPWDGKYKSVSVTCNRPIKEQTSVVYFLPSPIAITNGVAFTVKPKYGITENPIISSFTGNTLANGSGTDITSNISVTSNSLSYNTGSIVFATTASGYLTKLEIRGRKYKIVEEECTTGTSSGSLFRLDTPYLQDPNYAEQFDGELYDYLETNREFLEVQIEQRPTYQYPIDVMDKVAFTSTELGLDKTYYCLGIDHEWLEETGQSVLTTLYLYQLHSITTAVTAAPVEETPVPLGFENPAGDPSTFFDNPDIIDALEDALEAEADVKVYLQLSMKDGVTGTVSGGYINWGIGTADISYYTLTTKKYDKHLMYNPPATDRATCKVAGYYLCLLDVTHYQTIYDYANTDLEIIAFNTSDGMINSSGFAEFNIDTDTDQQILTYPMHRTLIAYLEVGEYVKCYCVRLGEIGATFQMIKIA